MKQNPNPSHFRATEVWKRFVGMFGGDSVLRKFGDEPPPEWIAIVEKLRDFELERGMRRLVYSGKGHVPTLPEFVKLCRTIGVAEGIEEPSEPVVALPDPNAWKGDDWDIRANKLLFRHVMERASQGWYFDEHATRILVARKHVWARDMREGKSIDKASGEVTPYPLEEQQAAWADCLERAEAAIAQKAAA